MSERPGYSHHTDEEFDQRYREYFGIDINLRWDMYRYAEKKDPKIEIIENYLSPEDSVLDIGCGRGYDLVRLLNVDQHKGMLVGLDREDTAFLSTSKQLGYLSLSSPYFVNGRAEELPFSDESYNAALALFVIYHARDPEESLAEIDRILKPEGIAIIGTSGRENKKFQRSMDFHLAGYLGVTPPPLFNESFTAEKAPNLLEKYFPNVLDLPWKSEVKIYSRSFEDQKWRALYYSALTMLRHFGEWPGITGREWGRGFKHTYELLADELFERQGFVKETIDRHYFVCQKQG
jgi:ubiquinone/menaquinone biosynthesis C-methylase UbiE